MRLIGFVTTATHGGILLDFQLPRPENRLWG
jgi:hypothetical protein